MEVDTNKSAISLHQLLEEQIYFKMNCPTIPISFQYPPLLTMIENNKN